MKYIKSCLIITMLAGLGFSQPCGDLNGDGNYNVIDIVILANCVLAENCEEPEWGWMGCPDINGDGNYNVLDIVILANCVLATNCD